MERYTEYCHKVNGAPEWSNVYNRVSVRLYNAEFEGVTTKEIAMGRYLDRLSAVSINKDLDDELRIDQITEVARLEIPGVQNDQNQTTSLYLTQ